MKKFLILMAMVVVSVFFFAACGPKDVASSGNAISTYGNGIVSSGNGMATNGNAG